MKKFFPSFLGFRGSSVSSVYSVVGGWEITEHTEFTELHGKRIGMLATKLLLCLLLGLSLVSVASAQPSDIFKRKAIEERMIRVAKWQLANPKHVL